MPIQALYITAELAKIALKSAQDLFVGFQHSVAFFDAFLKLGRVGLCVFIQVYVLYVCICIYVCVYSVVYYFSVNNSLLSLKLGRVGLCVFIYVGVCMSKYVCSSVMVVHIFSN